MFSLGQKTILFLSLAVLVVSGFLIIWLPDYNFFVGGLMTSVLLTLFIKSDFFTRLFTILGVLLIITSIFCPHNNPDFQDAFLQDLFSLLLLIGSSMFTLYVKKLYRTLTREEGQLNALFQNATEGIILINESGEIILINPETERIFNYTKSELLGKKIETLIPERFIERHLNYRVQFKENPSSRKMGRGRELFGKKKDGFEFPVEVSLSYFMEESKFFALAFIVDITLRKEAELGLILQKSKLEGMAQEMKQLNTELEEQVEKRTLNLKHALEQLEDSRRDLQEALSKEKELGEIKSKFVSMASHEFRTPLSTILSSASLLGKYIYSEDQEKRQKHIRKIRDGVKQLNNLLEDFLSLGKLEEGRVDIAGEEFDISFLLEEVLEEIKPILKIEQNIKMIQGGINNFRSDTRLLKAILHNLLSNASKFSPDRADILLEIQVNGILSLTVKDWGVGIPEQERHHLFSSFFRASNVNHIQGTGLGLHIVKRYVTLLGGSISVQSEENEGTEVNIQIPQID